MKVDTQVHGNVTVLVPHGPLITDELPSFRKTLDTATESRMGRVVIDMREVPFLDSTGIEALLTISGHVPGALARPRLAGLSDTCREALDLTDVLHRLDVFDTVENAIKSFAR